MSNSSLSNARRPKSTDGGTPLGDTPESCRFEITYTIPSASESEHRTWVFGAVLEWVSFSRVRSVTVDRSDGHHGPAVAGVSSRSDRYRISIAFDTSDDCDRVVERDAHRELLCQLEEFASDVRTQRWVTGVALDPEE